MKTEYVRDIVKEPSPTDARLIEALKSLIEVLSYAYVIDWIPEQGLTIYTVVVPDRQVAIVEIADVGTFEASLLSLNEFKHHNPKLSAERRRKLATIESMI